MGDSPSRSGAKTTVCLVDLTNREDTAELVRPNEEDVIIMPEDEEEEETK